MSGRQYTVAIKLVDKDGILGKIGVAAGGKSGGGSGSSGGGGGGILDKLAGVGVGQLLKLTGIGLGIAELVKIGVKSSGILQQNFKLWETSMMLIFRPITDFIGLILRPFTILMLEWFVLPFFKTVYPFFQKWGDDIAKFYLAHPEAMLTTIAGALTGAWILKQTSWPSLTLPGGNNGGGANPTAPAWPKCIELCDQTPAKFTKPVGDGVGQGINQSLLVPMLVGIGTALIAINISQLETKDEITKLNDSLQQTLKIPAGTPNGGKHFSVDLKDTLSVSEVIGTNTLQSIQTDWSQVATASGGIALAAGLAQANFERAAGAIGTAVGKLEAAASSIPNSFAFGFGYFGSGGGYNPVSARGKAAAMTLADARSI